MHTSWLTPNQAYEEALARFIARALTGAGGARLLSILLPCQSRIATLGMLNSLSQTVLKLGSPGVPDVYQATALWDLSLVDPDNRRPVDFDHRRRLLEEIDGLPARPFPERVARTAEVLASWPDRRIKMLVVAACLRLRHEHPELFLSKDYVPLQTEVTVNADVVAFARTQGEEAIVFIGPRLCAPLVDADLRLPLGGDSWKTSRVLLPPGFADRTFRHELTGAELRPRRRAATAQCSPGRFSRPFQSGSCEHCNARLATMGASPCVATSPRKGRAHGRRTAGVRAFGHARAPRSCGRTRPRTAAALPSPLETCLRTRGEARAASVAARSLATSRVRSSRS